MDIRLFLQTISIALATLFLWMLWMAKTKKDSKAPPEVAGGWPIIGHLPLFVGETTPHRVLAKLAEKFGSIYTLRIGLQRAVVVTGWEEAKECFTTKDLTLASRPFKLAGELMGYDYAMIGLAPYGRLWRELRKIATVKLLSATRLDLLKDVRAFEVDMCMKELFRTWVANGRRPVKVNFRVRLEELMFNIVMQMLARKRYFGENVAEADEEMARQFRSSVNEFLHLLVVSSTYDALPFLKWLDLKGHLRAMKRVAGEMDRILQSWVEEHRRKEFSRDSSERSEDFIDVLLATVRDGQFPGARHDADTIIKATLLALLAAGIDTTSVTLEWALALLVKNSHVLEKAQAELDVHVGRDRVVDESDTVKLKYLHAIVKEVLRLYPAVPLLVPHKATEECCVGNFRFARGSTLLVNAWKIQRDPRVWSDPGAFLPERFLTTHVDYDVKGQHFDLIPFGTGRRSCPGMGLAVEVLHLTLARVLQAFDLKAIPNEEIEMEECFDMVLTKSTPLQVMLAPRLPLGLYE